MFDLDPQIIKIGKIFAGMILGLFAARLIMDIAHIDGLIPHIIGICLGFISGGGFMVVHLYKKEGKEDDE